MYYYNGFYPSSMFGFGPILMIVFWVVLIYIVISIFRNSGHFHGKNNAMDILKERYVKGEITKEQFESMKKDLH